MKKILAISGGIDSMVMLNLFLNSANYDNQNLIVAHFDHGARVSSSKDADFVRETAQQAGVEFVMQKAELGEMVSEEKAREKRYEFLKNISLQNNNAEIYTAHHLDDLVESVTINLTRGTGWRGLTVLNMQNIRRPFLEPELLKTLGYNSALSKKQLLQYAANHGVVFREDPTNNSDNYLRNRIRPQTKKLSDGQKIQIYNLWLKQKDLRTEIEVLVENLLPKKNEAWQRAWFHNLDQAVALELLRTGTNDANIPATKPQLLDFLEAIQTYRSGKCFNLPQDNLIKFSKTDFYL